MDGRLLNHGDFRSVAAYIQLIRPYGPLLLGLSVILGELIALEDIPTLQQALFGFSSSFLLTASSFAINDYVDVEIDHINAPDRPIPKGIVSKNSALLYGMILSGAGLVLAILLGAYPFVIASLTFLLSVWYSLRGKQTGLLGNMTVAFCVAQPIFYGAVISTDTLNMTVTLVFLLTFLSNAGREVTKGIADAEGDATKKVRSVALLHGAGTASLLASMFFLLTAITGPIIFWHVSGSLDMISFLLILVAEVGFVYSSFSLARKPTKNVALKVTTQTNIWMIIIVLALLLKHLVKLLPVK